MIEKLIKIEIDNFDKESLKMLKPYFDLDIIKCSLDQRQLWFQNLFVLAQYDLSIAHCVQHNHRPRMLLQHVFEDKKYPVFYDAVYENQIGCYSGWKTADTMKLDGKTLSGTKHWISLVDRAEFAVFRVPVDDTELYLLLDFNKIKPKITFDHSVPIGMKLARPGSVTIDHYSVGDTDILGFCKYTENQPEFFTNSQFSDYCFTTNYVGLIVALYKDLENYLVRTKINADFDLKKIGLKISAMVMMWEDNLASTHLTENNDKFWRRRNTQYVHGKQVLIELISLILQLGDSSWLDACSVKNKRFRDALTFSSHMRPLQRNLQERHFFDWSQ